MSSAGKFAPQISELPEFLHYLSPEQVSGEAIDARSNLFSLGAMFYEMVTERKAFDGADFESLCQSIVEGQPTPPVQLNAKIHPLLSDLIMKTIHKDPAQRYQRGRELLDDLEQCKESKGAAAKKPTPAPSPTAQAIPGAAKAAVQSKFIASAAAKTPQPVAAAANIPIAAKTPVAKAAERPTVSANAPQAATASKLATSPTISAKIETPPPQAAAAGAVRSVGKSASGLPAGQTNQIAAPPVKAPPLQVSRIKATVEAPEKSSSHRSTEVEEQIETFAAGSKIAVDPMMAEGGGRTGATSFSEISELPPLKEVYVEAPQPDPLPAIEAKPIVGGTIYQENSGQEEEEKKIQPREAAQKAIKEIRNVPPRLMLYSIAGAVALILIIGIALVLHIHSLNSEDDSAARTTTATESPAVAPPATSAQAAPVESAPVPAGEVAAEPEQPRVEPHTAIAQPVTRSHGGRSKKKSVPAAAPVVIPGQLVLDSTPQGAQAQVDGRTDPSYVTPFLLPGMTPGQHTITVSKAGYSNDTRSVEVSSGNKTSLVIHLTQLTATLSVTSSPAGANIFIDGRDVGKTTPAQVNVDKGQHVVLIRKMGFIDETANPQFVLGQTVSLSPLLRPLGNADSIRTVGKVKKLFGGSGIGAGQITVSIKTQPKGAQVTINQHMLEKGTPVEVALDPGNYEVDITLSGYAPIHKVITADKGSKLVVDETLQRQ
jgi:hypothetical protein